MSEKYKSAWVYYALPIDEPGKILSGMYKAIVTLYFFPYCLVLSIIIVGMGPQAINDLIFGLFGKYCIWYDDGIVYAEGTAFFKTSDC